MFKNHLKIAWRNLKSNALFSTINIVGLTLSLAITILLFLFVQHERSFNTSFTQADNIYRVLVQTGESWDGKVLANAPAIVAPATMDEIPEVLDAVRLYKHGFGDAAYINAGDAEFIEPNLYYADPNLFSIFDLELKYGVTQTSLSNPNTAIISTATAQQYFSQENVIGKMLTIDNDTKVEITGVFEDLPKNISLDANLFVSFETTFFAANPTWSNASLETFLVLAPGATMATVETKMQELLDKNVEKDGQWYSLFLQPLNQVHLYSQDYLYSYSSRKGSIEQVKSLSLLAILILVIACINYMNLTTARSQKRSREVGVSKTLGATFSNLVTRFYTETGMITAISIMAGVLISIIALPYFNDLAGKEIPLEAFTSPWFLVSLIAIWFLATVLAGSYPAIYLSSFSAKQVLNPGSTKSYIATIFRKSLVVLQFGASAVLIVGVFIIYNQLQFIQNRDLGFNPQQVVAVSTNGINGAGKADLLTQELLKLPEVEAVGAAQGYPSKGVSGRAVHNPLENDGGMPVQTNRASSSAIDVMQLKFIAGKNLPKVKAAGDSLVDVVVNKKVADYLGYTPEEAIGQQIFMMPTDNAQIIGVVEDFNYASLREPVGAYAFHNFESERLEYLLIRITSTDIAATVNKMEGKFQSIVPNVPFDYSFLDQNVENLYLAEKQTAAIGLIFSILAIVVACLGLFGLAAFMAEQRDKEIGVRKVLGASILNITNLLSKDFLKLVGISLLIAFPISYWLLNNWLQEFAYRIDIGWQPFVITGATALIIALLTVSIQSIKAAVKNPINALRKE
jgi:ABC-type antimicrobial peptide transport system permease subunit